MSRRAPAWLLGLVPLLLVVAGVALFVVLDAPGVGERRGPPAEELAVERTTLRPGVIELRVRNDGPDAVALAQVQVNDAELSERIVYQAQRFGISPDEYVQRAQQAGQLGAIFADVRRGKALASVVRQATVTDASGNAVDLDELFGAPAAPAVAESADEAAEQE